MTEPSDPLTALPELPLIAERVAHDLRGPLGVVVSALHELEQELNAPGGLDVAAALRLLEMARRGTRKLERTAARLDALAHRERRTPAHVDLHPLVVEAARRTAQLERRPDVPLRLPATTHKAIRVRVVPQTFEHALEDVLAWALKRSHRGVDVELLTSADENTCCVVVTARDVDTVPGTVVPFQDPLGMAQWLLMSMAGKVSAKLEERDVVVTVSVPAGPLVGAP
jgi:signal transduction histidine kinase